MTSLTRTNGGNESENTASGAEAAQAAGNQTAAPNQNSSKATSSLFGGRRTTRSKKKGKSVPTSLHEGAVLLAGDRCVDPQAAERFRILRSRIERANLTHDYRVISVLSAVPEEGKSLVATNLARALALDPTGKTLLVDCDLRKPSVNRYCGLSCSPGLSDVLAGSVALESAVTSLEPGLDVLTAGSSVTDAARAVEMPSFVHLIRELKARYRYVVLDCPPVLLCPEPLTLSTISDTSLLVVRAWRTQKKLVRDAVKILGKEKLLGIVVNDTNDVLNDYGYYGYYAPDRGPNRIADKGNGFLQGGRAKSVGNLVYNGK